MKALSGAAEIAPTQLMNAVRRLLTRHRAVLTSTVIAFVAIAATWGLVYVETGEDPIATNWAAFAVFSVALVACEYWPAAWIRFGTAGLVTPVSMFALALMLIGSPSLAVGVAIVGTIVHAIRQSDRPADVVLRVGGTAIALSSAGFVMLALDLHDVGEQANQRPIAWAVAVFFSTITIVVMHTLVVATSMAIRRQVPLMALMPRGLAMRVTAEGALLSLAPIWVIGVDFGLVVTPLLAISTVLVFRSTQQALERSHEAYHDPLTGLVNRRSLLESLDEAMDQATTARTVSMLVMDLDGFKDINDRLGHQTGDSLLISFADRLEQNAPTGAVCARFGGDEFAVLISHPVRTDVIDEATKLHQALTEPLTVEGFPVTVGVSIGTATAPTDGDTSRDLLRSADVAMYKAKRTGSTIEDYASCVKGSRRGRLNLLSDLGEALQNHEFHIHFQPQLKMSNGRVDTVEALIRWQHPEHGSIPPHEFIGLAEQTDLIVPITEMVLRVATRGVVHSGVTSNLAVNVSPRNLQDPNFADDVLNVLMETGFRADRLELEVTERSIVDNAERCRFTIDRLRARGVRIAIDDFGIGYSSFQALRMLDVDRIKIDREFVVGVLDSERDRIIVASVIQLAHDLGLDVVAEGVENTELWDAIGDLGCDVAQGYGIAAPMAYPELRGWLSSWNELTVEQIPVGAPVPPTPIRLPARIADPPRIPIGGS